MPGHSPTAMAEPIIGKTRIPEHILNKKGPLTEGEWAVMKQHPQLGKEMVDKTCISYVGPVILQHHERLDGSGYPLGLSGDEILIEAQIAAVVDSYDAMTTDRPYRKALTAQWALDELCKGAGTLYAEEVVEALHKVVAETTTEGVGT